MERMTRKENAQFYTLVHDGAAEAAIQKLGKYEDLHEALAESYAGVLDKMDTLRAEDKNKTVTYQQLIAEKLMLANLLDRFKVYGISD